jgi:hypothetical protein
LHSYQGGEEKKQETGWFLVFICLSYMFATMIDPTMI